MGRNKEHLPAKSLKTLFILYTLACILSAFLASLFFSAMCQLGQSKNI